MRRPDGIQPGETFLITHEDVGKIAELARLELTPEEVTSLASQLSSILDYVAKLDELDTSDVSPMSHCATARDNSDYALRDDVARPGLGQEIATRNAPDADEGFFRVPRVIGG